VHRQRSQMGKGLPCVEPLALHAGGARCSVQDVALRFERCRHRRRFRCH
jgi:hypothetical protein